MSGERLPADVKRGSVLRRLPPLETIRLRKLPANAGDVCAFHLPSDVAPITLEAPAARFFTVAPDDVFLATPGVRESTRWVSGAVPAGGLVPGNSYWVLSDCGIVGELTGNPPGHEDHLGRVRYLGTICDDYGQTLNIRQFAANGSAGEDRNAPVYLIVGTSGNSGKTTAGVAVLRTMRATGRQNVIAIKATGTPAVGELMTYLDFGASQAFDCIDFGLATTYSPLGEEIKEVFASALDFFFSLPADALVVECGGDLFGAGVPEFLACVTTRRPNLKIVLAAGDALGALGAKQTLAELGLAIDLITGPCTDTPALRQRTQALCGVPAINLVRSAGQGIGSASV